MRGRGGESAYRRAPSAVDRRWHFGFDALVRKLKAEPEGDAEVAEGRRGHEAKADASLALHVGLLTIDGEEGALTEVAHLKPQGAGARETRRVVVDSGRILDAGGDGATEAR